MPVYGIEDLTRHRFFDTASFPRIQSLAVLPLENLSGDPSQEYFADGMTDELITDLASIASLRVISRTSSSHYKGTRETLPEIARELHVDAVIEGTVVRSGNQVRVTVQLIDAKNDRHIWAQSYNRQGNDVLGLQRDLSKAIASQVHLMRIRNFGFLANRRRAELLPLCFRLLQQSDQPAAGTNSPAAHPTHSQWNCPLCGGTMQLVERLSAAQLLLRSPPHFSRGTA